jgi:hypothetical protein
MHTYDSCSSTARTKGWPPWSPSSAWLPRGGRALVPPGHAVRCDARTYVVLHRLGVAHQSRPLKSPTECRPVKSAACAASACCCRRRSGRCQPLGGSTLPPRLAPHTALCLQTRPVDLSNAKYIVPHVTFILHSSCNIVFTFAQHADVAMSCLKCIHQTATGAGDVTIWTKQLISRDLGIVQRQDRRQKNRISTGFSIARIIAGAPRKFPASGSHEFSSSSRPHQAT